MASSLVTATAGAALGTSPPSPSVGNGSTDICGVIGFGSGTAPTIGALINIIPGIGLSNLSTNTLGVALTPMNAATAALGVLYGAWSGDARTLTVSSTVAPLTSQPAGTYLISYTITGI